MTSKLQVGDLVLWDHPSAKSPHSAPLSIGMIISVFCSDPPIDGSLSTLLSFRHPFHVFWFDDLSTTRHSSKYLTRLETTNDK